MPNNKEPKIARLREIIDNLESSKSSSKSKKIFSEVSRNMSLVTSDDTFEEAAEELAYAETKGRKSSEKGKQGLRGNWRGKATARDKETEVRFTTVNQVYDYALTLLTFRDYSKAEMYAKLLKKGAEEKLAQAAVDKLLEYNFLNEERYAYRVYEMWLAKRVYGRAHLQAELKKRNVEQDCIELVMAKFTPELEEERAEAAAALFIQQNRRKLQELKKFDEPSYREVEDDFFANSLGKSKAGTAKTCKLGREKLSRVAAKMAAVKKVQAAAGRFMAARGFSARYMHILLNVLRSDNDM